MTLQAKMGVFDRSSLKAMVISGRASTGLVLSLLLSALNPTIVDAAPQQTFTQWCKEKNSGSAELQKTIDMMLRFVETTDCRQANLKLNRLTEFWLDETGISNVQPFSALTNLTKLRLTGTQISDIKPLANLKKLTSLSLSFSKISDVQPLATLTNLTKLRLTGNKISNIQPLATLINLKELSLQNNPIDVKVCPVKPASICKF